MSTVQSLLDVLQYHPDIQVNSDDLIHIVNQAVRTISKRLYVLGSSMIIGQMEVDIFASVDYTASIAFADSNPDTLTDAASQFVVEGFASGMPITTTHASNPGPFRIATAAVGTLTLATTDSVVAAIASSITVTSDDAYGYLPSDFWGLVSDNDKDAPYIEGKTTFLVPLPSSSAALQYTGSGEPIYYKIRGTKLYVTPHANANITVIADYYQKPTALTAETDTVPFNELFDDLISEYVEEYFRGAKSDKGGNLAALDKMIKDGVDLVAVRYDRKTPVHSQGINWG